jgi:TTC: tartrate dehydrogenase
VATEVSINTAYGVERVVRYAFQLAMKRRKHVTLVHKKNVLVNAGDMWQRIVDKVAEEYPEVTHDYLHIDATTIFMVSNPSRFDVILTDNLFGDIITDEAGAVVGGVGYSASGCINASDEYPVHVRADSRFRSGHRRSEQGQPDRRHPLRRHAARASRL